MGDSAAGEGLRQVWELASDPAGLQKSSVLALLRQDGDGARTAVVVLSDQPAGGQRQVSSHTRAGFGTGCSYGPGTCSSVV